MAAMLGYKDWSEQRSWRMQKKLGEGSFASVHAAVQADSGKQAAVKVLHKASEDNTPEVMRAEVDVMLEVARKLPRHAHLVQLLDVYEVGRGPPGSGLRGALVQAPAGPCRSAPGSRGSTSQASDAGHRFERACPHGPGPVTPPRPAQGRGDPRRPAAPAVRRMQRACTC
jgi:hypothetical protein